MNLHQKLQEFEGYQSKHKTIILHGSKIGISPGSMRKMKYYYHRHFLITDEDLFNVPPAAVDLINAAIEEDNADYDLGAAIAYSAAKYVAGKEFAAQLIFLAGLLYVEGDRDRDIHFQLNMYPDFGFRLSMQIPTDEEIRDYCLNAATHKLKGDKKWRKYLYYKDGWYNAYMKQHFEELEQAIIDGIEIHEAAWNSDEGEAHGEWIFKLPKFNWHEPSEIEVPWDRFVEYADRAAIMSDYNKEHNKEHNKELAKKATYKKWQDKWVDIVVQYYTMDKTNEFSTSLLNAFGFTSHNLTAAVKNGIIKRIKWGTYSITNLE